MIKKCRCGKQFEQYLPVQNKCVECLIKKGITLKTKYEKQEDKQRKEKIKTLTQLINEARKPFQKWIRTRDKNRPCISCGNNTSLIWDAGHFYKAELYSALIFEEKNVHKQCRKCNCYLSGNEVEYRIGLLMRYGGAYVAELELKVEKQRIKKYERLELQEIKNKYILKLKQEANL